MPNPTRDDIKQAAEHCLRNDNCHGCPGINTRCTRTLARAYLALREQVETVAIPLLRRAYRNHSPTCPECRTVGREPSADAWNAELGAAIKAIEEGGE